MIGFIKSCFRFLAVGFPLSLHLDSLAVGIERGVSLIGMLQLFFRLLLAKDYQFFHLVYQGLKEDSLLDGLFHPKAIQYFLRLCTHWDDSFELLELFVSLSLNFERRGNVWFCQS